VTPADAVLLVRYVRALCPHQKIDEYTPDAWHDLLANYDLDACRTACAELAARQPFIAPAEIITEVRKARTARLDGFQYEPCGDETVDQYLTRLRGQLRAVAGGHAASAGTPMLTGGPHRSVEVRLAEIGRPVPSDGPDHRPGARSVECPTCKALVGRDCRTPKGARRPPHPARSEAAGLPGVEPRMSPEQARHEAEQRRAATARAIPAPTEPFVPPARDEAAS
jgi:hypothetical protein